MVIEIVVPHTQVRMDLTRQGTTIQCTRLNRFSTTPSNYLSNLSTGYFSGSNDLIPHQICQWGDNIWAKNENNYTINGLQNNWRFIASADGNSFSVLSQCGASADTGAFTTYIFVR